MQDDKEIKLCPIEVKYIWEWFTKINKKRQGGMCINPIPFTEIESWSRLYGVSLSEFELDALDELDACYVHHFNKRETK